jgi:hypothetical protein
MTPLDWTVRAACDGMDTNLFYPLGGGQPESPEPVAACLRCLVVHECREFALTSRQSGYWGGMTEVDRASEHRRRLRQALKEAS